MDPSRARSACRRIRSPGSDGITTSNASAAVPPCAVGFGQRIDDFQLLDDRAGPSVRDDQRQRVRVLRADVNEVNVDAIDLPALREMVVAQARGGAVARHDVVVVEGEALLVGPPPAARPPGAGALEDVAAGDGAREPQRASGACAPGPGAAGAARAPSGGGRRAGAPAQAPWLRRLRSRALALRVNGARAKAPGRWSSTTRGRRRGPGRTAPRARRGCGRARRWRAGGAEEVELVAAQRAPLGGDAQRPRSRPRAVAPRGCARTRRTQHAQVEGRRRDADAAHVAAAAVEPEHEAELAAGEAARLEAREQPREQTLEHEAQRLEPLDANSRSMRFESRAGSGDGQRRLLAVAAREREEPSTRRAQAGAERAAREPQQVAHAPQPEARAGLGEGVRRVEELEGERRQEGAVTARCYARGASPGGRAASRRWRRAAMRATPREPATATPPGARARRARAERAAAKPASERNSEATPEASSRTAASAAQAPPRAGPASARGEAERRVEQRARAPPPRAPARRVDASSLHTRARVRRGAAREPHAPARRLGRDRDHLGARARARRHRERQARELGLRAQLRREREIGHQAACDARGLMPPARRAAQRDGARRAGRRAGAPARPRSRARRAAPACP